MAHTRITTNRIAALLEPGAGDARTRVSSANASALLSYAATDGKVRATKASMSVLMRVGPDTPAAIFAQPIYM